MAYFYTFLCEEYLFIIYNLKETFMKVTSTLVLSLALLTPAISAVAAHPIAPMNCPAPESITWEGNHFTAPVTQEGWQGSWNSSIHAQSTVKKFTNALYFAKKGLSEGVLVNCTYALSNGKEIDLTYSLQGEEKKLSNLIVSIDDAAVWIPESNSRLERFYDCDKSAQECKFNAINVVYQ